MPATSVSQMNIPGNGLVSANRILGIMSIVIPSIFIGAAAIVNPWFSVFSNAYSDLGAATSNNQWIFNYGLIISSAIIFTFAASQALLSSNRIEVISAAFLMEDSFFLALIGIFFEGTAYHFIFSVLFFAQAAIVVFTWGVGVIARGRLAYGTAGLLMAIGGAAGSILIPFPSVALLETFGIGIMFVWVILVLILGPGAD